MIYIDQVYDKFYNIREDDVIIDVGAHVGVFTLKASRKAKEGKVIAIEPHPQNYMLLLKNITINKLENVIPINLALSDSEGVAKLYISQFSPGHTIKEKRIGLCREGFPNISYIEIKTKTLDQIVDELGLKEVNFIKVDVEGAELDVL
ncbi:MAG: FkbM family methyltransferase, partial [Thermofilaceae archaeon]